VSDRDTSENSNQETIFGCINDLTNSNGNPAIPLSSNGLSVSDQADVRSVCAPDAPCLEFNALLAGPLEEIAIQCGFLEKLLRMEPKRRFASSSWTGFRAKKIRNPRASSKPLRRKRTRGEQLRRLGGSQLDALAGC